MLFEVLIGVLIAIVFVAGAIFFAFKTPNLKGPSRHNIRGDGDYADSHPPGNRSFDSGGDGGSDGGD